MADGEVESLIAAQQKRYTAVVNTMARRLGVSYRRWPGVTETMQLCQIDGIELSAFLAEAVVVETTRVFDVMRYRLESTDHAERIASVTVSVWLDIVTIEVISLRIKEA